MNACHTIRPLLEASLDGTLTPAQEAAVAEHLRDCSSCQAERAALEQLRSAVRALPAQLDPPRDLWPGIEARLAPPARPAPPPPPAAERLPRRQQPQQPSSPLRARRRLMMTAAVVLTLLGGAAGLLWLSLPDGNPGWEVTRLAGTPRVGPAPLGDTGQLRVGEVLETGPAGRARLGVGRIGRVDVAPGTRLRLLSAHPADQRLALEAGTIHARIWAPPRLFFVETPSALAIDLGCEYILSVDSTGGSLLHVRSGYVELAFGDRRAVVPAGWMCRTQAGKGPGTLFDPEASDRLRHALRRYDFEGGGTGALREVLAASTRADVATLWSLFTRAGTAERALLYDRLAELSPPPPTVTRAGVLHGDPAQLDAWRLHLNVDILLW